ncbi:MAG: very short patch repair endonuclease [Chloroflexota bacterium]
MPDIVTPAVRSRMMAGIKSKNTKPEQFIRKTLHRLGYRYRLHVRHLPGKPDLVFRKYNAVIFVHGCFWHGHDCHLFKWPKSREEFWKTKITRNQVKDIENREALMNRGWRVLEIWECALKGKTRLDPAILVEQIVSWLDSSEVKLVIRGQQAEDL